MTTRFFILMHKQDMLVLGFLLLSFATSLPLYPIGEIEYLPSYLTDNDVYSIASSPSHLIAVGSIKSAGIKVYRMSDMSLFMLEGHVGGTNTLLFIDDNTLISGGGSDFLIKVWDIKTRTLSKTLTGHAGGVRSLLFHKFTGYLISGAFDSYIKIWNLATGSNVKTLYSHTGWVLSIVSLPNDWFASSSTDKSIIVWDRDFYNQITVKTADTVEQLATTSEGALVAACRDKSVTIYNAVVTTGNFLISYAMTAKIVIRGLHTAAIRAVAVLANGDILTSGEDKLLIRISNIVDSTNFKYSLVPVNDKVLVIKVLGDGTVLTGGAARILSRYKLMCSTPSTGSYVDAPCTAAADTVIKPCSAIPLGSYKPAAGTCVTGSFNEKGKDTVYLPCSQPINGFTFTSSPCTSGSLTNATVVGVDSVMKSCTTVIPDNMFVSKECVPGDGVTLLGSGTEVNPCDLTAPPKSYFKKSCVKGDSLRVGSNSVFSPCSTPAKLQLVVTECVTGSSNTAGTDAAIVSCASPPLGSFVTAPCTTSQNTMSAKCKSPSSDQYTTTECVSGDASTMGSDTVIQACSSSPSSTGNYFTKGTCRSGSFDVAGSNTLYEICASPKAGETYVIKVCIPGDYKSLGSNTVLIPCSKSTSSRVVSVCSPGSYNLPGNDLILTACSGGYYCLADGTSKECPPSFYCPESFSVESSPIQCTLGDYCPTKSDHRTVCEAGFYCPTPSSKIECTLGSYCASGSIAPLPCPPKNFCLYPNIMQPCNNGMLCPETSTFPEFCPAGYFCDGLSKRPCEAGNYCIAGSPVETKCEGPGSYCPPGSKLQGVCERGTYCPTSAAAVPCPRGFFCDDGSVEPTACPKGTYNDFLSKGDVRDCTPCEFPKTTRFPGTVDMAQCVCPRQYYLSSTTGKCIACNEGDGLLCENDNLSVWNVTAKSCYFKVVDSSGLAVAYACGSSGCERNTSSSEICQGGYEGFLCASCKPNYFNSQSLQSSVKCKSCGTNGLILYLEVFAGFLLTLMFVGVYVYIRISKRKEIVMEDRVKVHGGYGSGASSDEEGAADDTETRNEESSAREIRSSVIPRLALNHLTVLGLIGRLNMPLPKLVTWLFGMGDSMSSLGFLNNDFDIAAGIKCLLYPPPSLLPAPASNLLMNLVVLLCCLAAVVLGWLGRFWYKGLGRQYCSTTGLAKIKISTITIVYVMYNSILRAFLQLYACTSYVHDGGLRRLQGALDVICWSPYHTKVTNYLGIPVFVCFVVAMPSIGFLKLLWEQRHDRLNTIHVRSTYGFLFHGYKPKYWFYETIILLRKMALSAVSVFLLNHNVASNPGGKYQQGLWALLILGSSIVVHLSLEPYQDQFLNFLEAFGLGIATLSVYAGLWTLAAQDASIYHEINIACTIAIYIANIIWLTYLVQTFAKESNIREKVVSFLASKLCCCLDLNKKKKMQSWANSFNNPLGGVDLELASIKRAGSGKSSKKK